MMSCILAGGCWACGRTAHRMCAPRKQRQRPKYRLLPVADHEEKPFTTKDLDTETDSDVLFESRSKMTSFTKRTNGELSQPSWKKNGHYEPKKVNT